MGRPDFRSLSETAADRLFSPWLIQGGRRKQQDRGKTPKRIRGGQEQEQEGGEKTRRNPYELGMNTLLLFQVRGHTHTHICSQRQLISCLSVLSSISFSLQRPLSGSGIDFNTHTQETKHTLTLSSQTAEQFKNAVQFRQFIIPFI